MKKLIFVLVLFILFIQNGFSQQQVQPPAHGWSLIYDDTLNFGKREVIWSFLGAGSMGAFDVALAVDVKHTWGGGTLGINLDLQNVSKVVDSLRFGIAGYNTETSTIQRYYTNITSDYTLIDTLDRANVADGEYYMNLSYLGNQTFWAKQEHILFYMGGTDTVRIRLYLLKD